MDKTDGVVITDRFPQTSVTAWPLGPPWVCGPLWMRDDACVLVAAHITRSHPVCDIILLRLCAAPLIHLSWGRDAECDELDASYNTLHYLCSQRPNTDAAIPKTSSKNSSYRHCAVIKQMMLYMGSCVCLSVCMRQIFQRRLQVNPSESLQFHALPTFAWCLVSMCQCLGLNSFYLLHGFHLLPFLSSVLPLLSSILNLSEAVKSCSASVYFCQLIKGE